jgi:hypothetical protein
VPGQPCLDPVTPEAVVDAVDLLAGPAPALGPVRTAATAATPATTPVLQPEEVR